jgi:hypothetical protein
VGFNRGEAHKGRVEEVLPGGRLFNHLTIKLFDFNEKRGLF